MNSPSDLAGASLIDALFGVELSQHARLITITSSQNSALPQALVTERSTGREAINELLSFDVDALSTSIDLDLANVFGEKLAITLLQPDRGQSHAFQPLISRCQVVLRTNRQRTAYPSPMFVRMRLRLPTIWSVRHSGL